jgi:tetratricopeptide (TPR) repeat protein
LRARKADVMLLVGKWVELEELYLQDFGKAVAGDLRELQARILMRHGELLGWRNQNKNAGELLGQAMSIYRELGDDEGWTQCENGLAVTCIALGEYDKAEAFITDAECRARQHDQKAHLCWLLNSHATLCKERGLFDQAISHLEEKLAISRELEAIDDVASGHMNLAVVLSEKGRHDLALEHNETALSLSHKIGDVVLQNYTAYNQARILDHLGRKAEGLVYYRIALDISRHLGDEPGEKLVLAEIARVESKNIKNR